MWIDPKEVKRAASYKYILSLSNHMHSKFCRIYVSVSRCLWVCVLVSFHVCVGAYCTKYNDNNNHIISAWHFCGGLLLWSPSMNVRCVLEGWTILLTYEFKDIQTEYSGHVWKNVSKPFPNVSPFSCTSNNNLLPSPLHQSFSLPTIS